jgi:hypothetical protein
MHVCLEGTLHTIMALVSATSFIRVRSGQASLCSFSTYNLRVISHAQQVCDHMPMHAASYNAAAGVLVAEAAAGVLVAEVSK